ncbi:MAG: adenine deaminase [Phycisphaerales bacterium]|nr:adenine deaminase [Phycisphaerales bacterium]
MIERTDPEFVRAACGDGVADLVVENAQVVNVFTRAIEPRSILIMGGRIAAVLPDGSPANARERVDAQGRLALPGFIDAHVHIESMMLPPSTCAGLVVAHGTTGLVADPHEIANVAGIPGIRWMMEDARNAPIRIWFTASSCVPASNLETAAATLARDDLAPLFDDPRMIALAEMMNFPGTIAADESIMAKIALGLARRGRVDGHAPGLRGRRLQAYIAAGPSSDHESFTAEEAAEKLALGQRVFIREGSAARNLAALLPVVTPANAHRVCFCTDDVHAFEAAEDGHLDRVIRRAAAMGFDGPTAVAMASLHVAEHFGLHDYGAIAPGMAADFSLARTTRGDWSDLTIEATWVEGRLVARDGGCVAPCDTLPVPAFLRGTVHLPSGLTAASFAIPAMEGIPARVVGIIPGQIVTKSLREVPKVVNGRLAADPSRDLLLLVSIERHGGPGRVGVGLVRGFGLREGAIASTVGHDAHNLSVAGSDPQDMLAAAKRLAELGGGQCIVAKGKVLAELPLAIAGILSDEPPAAVARRQHAMQAAYESLGGTLTDPFMQLAFLPLSVIPSLKVSDCGIIDVDAFTVVPLQEH